MFITSSHADYGCQTGLDPNRYRATTVTESESQGFNTLDSLMSDSERFKDVDQFLIRCRSCMGEVAFGPVADKEVSPSVLLCTMN